MKLFSEPLRYIFISAHDIDSPGSGGAIATWHILRALREGFGTSALIFVRPNAVDAASTLGFTKVCVSPPRGFAQKLGGLFSGQRDRSGPSLQANERLIRAFDPHFAFVDGGMLWGAVRFLSDRMIPVVTFHHNDESEYRRHAPESRVLGLIKSLDAKILQRKVSARSAINLTFTARDRAQLSQGFDSRKFACVGFGESAPSNLRRISAHTLTPLKLCVTGEFAMRKGYRAIENLVEVFDRYPERLRDVRVLYGGRGLHGRLRAKVERMGFTECETQMALDRGHIYVNMGDIPGGIKIRNCQAAMNGLPLLLHDHSLPGFEMFLGQFVESFRDQGEFLTKLDLLARRLHAKQFSRESIAAAYRELFSTKAFASRLRSAILSALRQHACTGISN